MKADRRWVRWPAIAGGGMAALSLAGMLVSAQHARVSARVEADAAIARAVAGYLSLSIPSDAAGRYDPARLLSETSALAGASFWHGGLQVAWGTEPLLPDRIRLGRLDPATASRLVEGEDQVAVDRSGVGRVSIVPLLDPDLWAGTGWVAVWGAVPPSHPDAAALAIALVAAIGIALTVHLARPRERKVRRRLGWMLAAGAALVLALRLWIGASAVAHRATDTMLLAARHLVELAASAPGSRENRLSRIVSGWHLRRLEAAGAPRDEVLRRVEGGQRQAVVIAGLRGGTGLEISTLPGEARLDGLAGALLGWWLSIGLGLGFAVWAGPAQENPRQFRETLGAWSFVGPALAHLAICSFAPVGFAVYLAFHRWGLIEPDRPFVGPANFVQVLGDSRFWHSLQVTVVYSLYVPVAMALALAAAVALDRSGVRVRVLRTILFLPFVASVVAVALVWQWLYQPEFGLINAGLRLLGVTGPDWLGDPRTALGAVMIMSAWVQIGYQMVLFLGGLQAIPEVYHDAARVDGAGAWQRFRWVTWPLLRPTVLFVLVTGTINSFQVFTYISVMTDGGPLYATDALVFRTYQEAWEFLRFGTASAMSLLLLLILIALTWLQFRWLGKRVEIV